MQITQADMDEIMTQAQGKLGKEYSETILALITMFDKGPNASTLFSMISAKCLAEGMQKGKGLDEIAYAAANIGNSAGLAIGYLLGLREAGLALGIETPKTSDKSGGE